MKLEDPDVRLSRADIARIESAIGLRFPEPVRAHYLEVNGGSPEPYIFRDKQLDTDVSEVLPLRSRRGTGTAVQAYRSLVTRKRIVPRQFFPFAVDSGGDYFFVDCESKNGEVHYYSQDTSYGHPENHLLALKVPFAKFWLSLVSEE